MHITENKKILRQELLAARADCPAVAKQEIDRLILEQLLSSEYFRQAKTIFTYCSTAEEIDTQGILHHSLQQGKTLCLPRCEQQRGIMTARKIEAITDLVSGRFGIPEPSEKSPVIAPEQIDLCIVPCLAADFSGYRLGYGGGYYDRFLPQVAGTTLILCAESRLLSELPHDSFDIPCDIIYTERRSLICETSKT